MRDPFIDTYSKIDPHSCGTRELKKYVHTYAPVSREDYERFVLYFRGSDYFHRVTEEGYTLVSFYDCENKDESLYYLEYPDGSVLRISCVFKRLPMLPVNEANAWKLYNFINDWKSGKFGIVSLQEAITDNFRI